MNGHNASAPDTSLSADERAEIEAMYACLGGTYYEILGVPRGCDQAALREAYRARCSRFHPELYEGVELGRYRTYLDAVFREVTNAFEVLCRPDLRAVYDSSLPPPRGPAALPPAPQPAPYAPAPFVSRAPTPPLEQRPVAAAVIAVGAGLPEGGGTRKPTPTAVALPPGTRSSPPSGVLRAPTPPGGSEAPQLPVEPVPFRAPGPAIPVPGTLKRTPTAALTNGALTGLVKRATAPGGASPSTAPGRTPSTPPPRGPSTAPQADAETTRAGLTRLRAEAMIRQKRHQRDEIEADIAAATRNNDAARVAQLLKHALTLEPDDASLKRRLEIAETGNVDKLAAQAKTHERNGRWDLAADLWSRAADLCPAEFSFHLYAAQAFCEAGTELPKAADLARKAARLKPDSVEAHVCLGRAFFKAGRVASARAAIETAAALAPQHPAVLELARQLRM